MLFKSIATAEFIIICVLIIVIIKKAKYDMEMEDYEDFSGTVSKKNYKYEGNGYYSHKIEIQYLFGSITLDNENLYNGFDKGDKVILRLKVTRNSKGDIIQASRKDMMVLRANVG